MSHWRDVKCDLKCSIDVMKRALLRINPEWERHMEVSTDGKLKIDNQYTRENARGGYHIKVTGARGGGAQDLYYADLGLKRNADGSWSITVDPAGANYVRNLQGYVTSMVQQQRAIAQAMINGHQVVGKPQFDLDTGEGEVDVEVEVDEDGNFISA